MASLWERPRATKSPPVAPRGPFRMLRMTFGSTTLATVLARLVRGSWAVHARFVTVVFSDHVRFEYNSRNSSCAASVRNQFANTSCIHEHSRSVREHFKTGSRTRHAFMNIRHPFVNSSSPVHEHSRSVHEHSRSVGSVHEQFKSNS